jgi:quinol monooxygenase YgiN
MMAIDTEGSILTIIEFTIDESRRAEFDKYIEEVAPGTRSFEGNLGFEIYRDPSNQAHVIHNVWWRNPEVQQMYMEWRRSTGVFDKIESYIVDGPRMTYWAWSREF